MKINFEIGIQIFCKNGLKIQIHHVIYKNRLSGSRAGGAGMRLVGLYVQFLNELWPILLFRLLCHTIYIFEELALREPVN